MKQNKFVYKIFCKVAEFLMKIFFPYEVQGEKNISDLNSTYILCCNHLSAIDPIFLMVTHAKPINFMAKSELFKNKLFSKLFYALGAFPVKRGKADKTAFNYALDITKNQKVLGIFIEGTRSKTGEFLRPKSGVAVLANQSEADVLPVCITGSLKDNKIRIFRKTTITYGKLIPHEKIIINENNRQDIKKATDFIMKSIAQLREKGVTHK